MEMVVKRVVGFKWENKEEISELKGIRHKEVNIFKEKLSTA